MAKILILFAHPALEKSRVHKRLVRQLRSIGEITFHDLYQEYPDYFIDVPREKALLLSHDIIIFQHPFHWYSSPAMVKLWEDLVLEHGWAYGSGGTALSGKKMLNIISAGGTENAYQKGGYNRFTIREFLAPFEQTARLCNMIYLPPVVLLGTHRMDDPEIESFGGLYRRIIESLRDDEHPVEHLLQFQYLNEAFDATEKEGQ